MTEIKNFCEFLKEFFRIYNTQNFYIELRFIGEKVKSIFIPYQDLLDNIRIEIPENDLKSYNIYFGVLPRFELKGSKESLRKGKCIWADIDFHDEVKKLQKREIENFVNTKIEIFLHKLKESGFPLPNVIIYTGRGFQTIWFLDEELNIEKIEDLNKKLREKLLKIFPDFNIDEHVYDAARILRLPFTINQNVGIETKLVRFETYFLPNTYLEKYLLENQQKNEKSEKIQISLEGLEFERRIHPDYRKAIARFFSVFWFEGYRNQLCTYLMGLLIKNQIHPEDAENIIFQISELTSDEEYKSNRQKVIEFHYKHLEKLKTGELAGISKLLEIIKFQIEKDYDRLIQNCELIYKKIYEKSKKPDKILKRICKLKELINGIKNGENTLFDLEMEIRQFLKVMKLQTDFTPSLEIHPGSELLKYNSKIEYVVDNLIPKNSIVLIFGKPGAGKSLVTQYIGMCIANGQKVFNHFDVQQRKVFYIDCETSLDLFSLRAKQLVNDLSDNFNYVQVENFSNLISHLKKILEKNSESVVVIDSLVRIVKDETKSNIISEFFKDVLKPLKSCCTIILVHHMRKPISEQSGFDLIFKARGSSDIVGMCDVVYFLDSETQKFEGGSRLNFSLLNLKSRYGPSNQVLTFTFEYREHENKFYVIFEGEKIQIGLEDLLKEYIIEFLSSKDEARFKEICDYCIEKMEKERGLKVSENDVRRSLQSLEMIGLILKLGRRYQISKERKIKEFTSEKELKIEEINNEEIKILDEIKIGKCSICKNENAQIVGEIEGAYICSNCLEKIKWK